MRTTTHRSPHPRGRDPYAVAIISTALLSATLTACGDNSDGTEPTPPPSSVSTAPSTSTATTQAPPATPGDKAVAQLEAYLEYRDTSLLAAKLDLKQLEKYSTGEEYLNLQQRVFATDSSGGSESGKYIHALGGPRDLGGEIIIQDCEDSRGVVRTGPKGNAVPPPVGPDGRVLTNPIPIDYTLVKERDRWLVSGHDVLWDQTC